MGVTKNFTQSAYNDIQAYIGGTEQWDDIRSIYGAVSNSGIYDYDYDACYFFHVLSPYKVIIIYFLRIELINPPFEIMF